MYILAHERIWQEYLPPYIMPQQDLLDLVGAKDAKEMNWDMDILPLFTFEVEVDED